jgi:hypothetical protein
MVYASGRAAATAGEMRDEGNSESVGAGAVPFMVAVCSVGFDCVVWRGGWRDGIGVERKIGCEGVYLGRQCVTVFNVSACLLYYNRCSSTRGCRSK